VSDPHLNLPDGVVVASDGTLYVSNRGDSSIQHFSSTGVFMNTVNVVTTGGTALVNPAGMRFGPNGDLYVSDNGTNAIQEFKLTSTGSGPTLQTTATWVSTPITLPDTPIGPGMSIRGVGGGITVGPKTPGAAAGPSNPLTFYGGNFVTGDVFQAGPQSTFIQGTFAHNPSGLLFLPNGNLLVSDLENASIFEYAAGVNYADPANLPTLFASGINFPSDLILEPTTGDVIVAELGLSENLIQPGTGGILSFKEDGTPDPLGLNILGLFSPSDLAFVAAPEPSTVVGLFGLCGMGLVILAVRRRRRAADGSV
jgi:hypothetical protein